MEGGGDIKKKRQRRRREGGRKRRKKVQKVLRVKGAQWQIVSIQMEGKKNPDLCDVVVFFLPSPHPPTSPDRPSLFSISGGNGGTAWRGDELAGVSGRRCIRRCDNGV